MFEETVGTEVSVEEAVKESVIKRRCLTTHPLSIDYYTNFNRYGKPWVGVIVGWQDGCKPELRWGNYLGDGELEYQARIGDIVRWGQHDSRKVYGGMNNWSMQTEDGLERITPGAAKKAFLSMYTKNGNLKRKAK